MYILFKETKVLFLTECGKLSGKNTVYNVFDLRQNKWVKTHLCDWISIYVSQMQWDFPFGNWEKSPFLGKIKQYIIWYYSLFKSIPSVQGKLRIG